MVIRQKHGYVDEYRLYQCLYYNWLYNVYIYGYIMFTFMNISVFICIVNIPNDVTWYFTLKIHGL